MKDSSISKYHLFSGVSVMVIAYLTLTTVVLYLKCFKLYVPDLSLIHISEPTRH